MSETTKKVLEEVVGLVKDENKVYTLILQNGFATIPSLAKEAKLKENKVQEILASLAQKQLVSKVKGKIERYIPLRPFGSFIKTLETYNNEIKQSEAELNKLQTEGEQQFNAIIEQAKTKITEIVNQTKDQISVGRNTAHKQFIDSAQKVTTAQEGVKTSVPETIQKKLEGVIGTFNQNTTSNATALDTKAKGFLTNYDTDIKAYIQQIQTDLAAIVNNNKTQSDALSKKIIDTVTHNQQGLKDFENSLIKSLKNQLAKFTEDLMNTKNLTKTQILTSLAEIQKIISSLDADLKGKWTEFNILITSQLKDIKQKSIEGINTYQSAVDTKLKEADVSQKDVLTKFRDQAKQDLSKINADFDTITIESTTNFENKITELIAASGEHSKNMELNIVEPSKKIVQDTITATKKFATDITAETKVLLDTKLESFKTSASKIKEVVTGTVQKEITRYKTEVKSSLEKIQNQYILAVEAAGDEYQRVYRDEINTQIVNLQDEVKKMQKQFETKVQENLNAQVGKLTTLQNEIIQSAGKSKGDWETKIQTDLSAKKTEITQNFATVQGQVFETQKADSTQVAENVDKTISTLSQNFADLSQEIANLSKDQTGNITSQMDGTSANITQTMTAKNTEFSKNLTDHYATLDKGCKEIPEKTITIASNNIADLGQKIMAKQDEAVKSLEDFKIGSQEIVTEIGTKLDEIVTQIPKNISEKFATTTAKLQEELKAVQGHINEFRASVEKSFQQSIQDGGVQGIQAVQGLIDKVKGNLDAVQTAVSTNLKGAEDLTQKSAEGLDAQIKTQLVATQQQMDGRIKENLGKAKLPLDKAFNASAIPLKILKDSFETVMETNLLDLEKTWIIVGQEQVMNYIHEIIGRAKSMITLIIPKFDDVDWKVVLDKQKTGCKFQVITDYLAAQNSKQVAKMVEAGIDLWSYGDHDMILCVRDREEEILIAPISSEDDTAAIVSEIGKFVEKMSTMAADFWRRSAKKYTPV